MKRRDFHAAEKPQLQFPFFIIPFITKQLFKLKIIQQLFFPLIWQFLILPAEPRAELPLLHIAQFQAFLFFIRAAADDYPEQAQTQPADRLPACTGRKAGIPLRTPARLYLLPCRVD